MKLDRATYSRLGIGQGVWKREAGTSMAIEQAEREESQKAILSQPRVSQESVKSVETIVTAFRLGAINYEQAKALMAQVK